MKSGTSNFRPVVLYADFEDAPAADRRNRLLGSLKIPVDGAGHVILQPRYELKYKMGRGATDVDYLNWPRAPVVFPHYFNGVKTNCDEFAVSIDDRPLRHRVKEFFSATTSHAEMRDLCPRAMEDRGDYQSVQGRVALQKLGQDTSAFVRMLYRPYDIRWAYLERRSSLVNRPRPEFQAHLDQEQVFIELRQTLPTEAFDRGLVTQVIGDTLGNGSSAYFPLRHRVSTIEGFRWEPNVSLALLECLHAARGGKLYQKDRHTLSKTSFGIAELVFFHAVAVLWSPAYRRENESALRQDWPRVPIPAEPAALDASAALGRAVADLLLPDKPVPGVTAGRLRPELRALGVPAKAGGGPIDPAADLKVEAGWGFRGQKNAVMCGKGKVVPHGGDPVTAVDIYLNDRMYWSNVPADVWSMTIGGYPVVKKWLSYREFKVLGRPLRMEEVTYVTEVVRRLKALLLLGERLDANYRAVKTDVLPWPAGSAKP